MTPHPAGPQTGIRPPQHARVQEVDALRGFALAGILLVNVLTMSGPVGLVGGRPDGGADTVALWLVNFLAQSKFYPIFSFLFGYSFTLQMASAERVGARVGPRTLRRLFGLFLLGALHAVFLYVGDILTTYALCGLILLASRGAAPRTAFRAALWLWGCFGGLLLVTAAAAALLDPAPDTGVGSAEKTTALVDAYRGGFADVVGANVDALPEAAAATLLMSGFVIAAFLVGLAAGKQHWLTTAEGPTLRRLLVTGLCVGVPTALFAAAGTAGPLSARWELLAAMVSVVAAPALSVAYASGLLLWFRTGGGARAVSVLAPAGRMALTNYLTQSLVMALLFTGYGLALYGRLGIAVPLAMALLLYAAQLALSARLMRRYRLGPVEWLLRKLTRFGEPGYRAEPADQGRPGTP
ncbi:DUF418 domain-containing protein [Streptomyces sp. NPDC012888]|uniref:DUF418 domain-containing protein n=1 Tax=Streptomyces sp. NPDC012888 TaxID=3364855 RepID=UPI0036AF691F